MEKKNKNFLPANERKKNGRPTLRVAFIHKNCACIHLCAVVVGDAMVTAIRQSGRRGFEKCAAYSGSDGRAGGKGWPG